ncbi:hypothetical protein [Dysgonomonas macrotermitis]|nr:hypothetical protein [Dysgonomonas macrotermitis]
MENLLMKLQCRIKGSRIYNASSGERLYIPYYIDRTHPVKVKVFFEVINARLKLFVEIQSNTYSKDWCLCKAEQIEDSLKSQLHEIIHDCEIKRNQYCLHKQLEDDIEPELSDVSPVETKAIRFLCQRKVGALISDSQSSRWLVAIRLVQSRYRAMQLERLIVFMPKEDIRQFKDLYSSIWKNKTFPALFISIESLSRNFQLYERLASYANSATMILIDSCHLFKSPLSVRSQRMENIANKCNYKLIMTDSLITNQIHDVYMQYNILDSLILRYYRWEDFSRMHIIFGGLDNNHILGYKNIGYLVDKIEPYTFSLENEKTNKCKAKIKTYTYYCDLTSRQKYHYSKKKTELLLLIEKNELTIHDVFRTFISLQKIVCGYPLGKDNIPGSSETNKLLLFKENVEENSIIFCKYLFEIDILLYFLGRRNCAVIRNKEDHSLEKDLFLQKKKKYLISTLYSPATKLSGIANCHNIVFFSLSFHYADYRRCFTYIADCGISGVVVKRFVTNSGIDKIIVENLKRKNKLAKELHSLLADKNRLAEFIKCL